MARVIEVNGYRAFIGTMRIHRGHPLKAEEIYGEWIYRPDTDKWYCKGAEYGALICTIVQVD